MKIIKIIHGYPPLYSAGSEVYSQSICEELSKENEVLVFTREENPFAPDFIMTERTVHRNLNVRAVNLPRGKDGYSHSEMDARFSETLKDFKADVVHIGHLNHLSTGIVRILKRANVPIIYTLHDFWLMCPRGQFLQRNIGGGQLHGLCSGQEDRKCALNCYRPLISDNADRHGIDLNHWTDWVNARMTEMRFLRDSIDLFIAPSHYLGQRFIRDFSIPKEKIRFIDYGFPTHYLTPSERKQPSEHYRFGYIGTHIPAKGINLLVNAFQDLPIEAELHIWGAENAQSTRVLKTMAEGYNNIHFMGEYVNKNLANEVFSKVDCIVVPSIWTENSPLVIHEAQACHIPVITANVGGMAEYVHHLRNGLLFEHRNKNSLKEQLLWATENRSEMKVLGKAGYIKDRDGEIPSIADHCEQLMAMYNEQMKLKK